MENNSEEQMYTEAYLEFHKSWENSMNSCVTKLNSCRASEEVTSVIRAVEELDSCPLQKEGQEDAGLDSKKAKTDDEVATQNKFSGLEINQGDSMDVTDPMEGTSATIVHPGATAPQKKLHLPPITIDNVKNQAALLKHLQTVTKQKLEAKLIGAQAPYLPSNPIRLPPN
ncbi:hypothetical protein TNIN_418371 [Trichonephila inaurata madagascariensis]|uniref:Uncharacterized protein n=2 Tax=Trichonephila inaurata madagascariensis TaxID=2747483 RepID=A0A8X6J4A1_9ARAC|nr:hypothetical protein TNIN_418371 [Trichonephila inaurata madagascariensis]